MASPARLASGLSMIALLLSACEQQPSAPPKPPEAAARQPVRAVDAAALQQHVETLASDEFGGRAPGTEGDEQTQVYIEQAMQSSGLLPAFGGSFRQVFTVTDGVRVVNGGRSGLSIGERELPHAVLPFAHSTTASGPLEAELVFVGYGIPSQGEEPGDYDGIEAAVQGRIVVALHGGPPDNPHLPSGATRPQTKMIAARDKGAVGFVLWDPSTDVPFPNHGSANDLQLPAVFVGTAGSATLRKAFVPKSSGPVKAASLGIPKGTKSRSLAKLQTDVERVEMQTANMGGMVEGNGSSSRVLIIGAHHDHLGMGTSSSLAPGETAIHNGADDNASGVAGVLEVCSAIAALPEAQRPYQLLCLTFGAEEMGLLGSKHFVGNMDEVLGENVVAMINFDMIGRSSDDKLIVSGVGTAPQWPGLVEAHQGALDVSTTPDGYGPSDHGSFYEAGLPVLHFFTGAHADYHKPSDDIDKINYEGMTAVTTMALGLVDQIIFEELVPTSAETKRSKPAGSRGFRVSLGSIPDYAADVDGVRLSGAREGGPAAKAGLVKGDVITRIGEREIHNLDDYMAAFGELEPEVDTRVEFMRDGEKVEVTLTPAAPRAH